MLLTLPFLDAPEISIERIYALYCGLKYGLTVKDWIEEQQLALLHIDERFGCENKQKTNKIFINV